MTYDVNWLVEEYVHDDDPSLVDTLKYLGYAVKILPHSFLLDTHVRGIGKYFNSLFPDNNDPIIFHGSLNTAKLVRNVERVWILADWESLRCVNYYSDEKVYPYLLNDQPVFFPLWMAGKFLNEMLIESFVRPDSPFKEFPGQVLRKGMDMDKFLKTQVSHEVDNPRALLTLAAKVVPLHAEARFLISHYGIVSASYYRKNGELEYSNLPLDRNNSMFLYMELLYNRGVFKDLLAANTGLLVVDVAKVSDKVDILTDAFKIIEFGSFSTSSLYEADFDRVVDIVSRVVDTMNTQGEL